MKNILQNRPLLRRNRCFWEKFVLLLPALFLFAAFSGCDLLLDKPEIELEKAIDEKAAYAGAPYVAILIDEGGLGTASPRGSLDTAVKLGYSFLVNYLPKSEYPFRGWQAKLEGSGEFLGVWNRETGEESGADKVRFVPLNEAGTEAEIFVFIKPEERIVIGPLGADAAELSVRVDEGGTGTANPRGSVSGVRLGFPFQVSFLPNANYDFNGWQVRREGSGNLLGSWAAGTEAQEGADIQFNPKNLAGTEMEITIRQISGEGTIVVEPLNAQNPFLTVELSAGGLGTISPTGTTTTTIKQGFPFSVSYAANSAYPFSGWQAKFEGETQLLASWTADGASGGDKVVFAPANITGTEVKVTILIDPAEEKIIIAPLGADYPELNVEVDEAGMGTASPRGTLAGIKQGIPFTLNYAARAEYPFTGWQAVYKGTAEIIASWTPEGATGSGIVSWKAVNIAGTETQVTIHVNPGSDRTIVIGPYGAKLPYVTVEVN
jgi:hypothetical protein